MNVLVDAAKLAPLVIIPQIVTLIVKEEMATPDFIYTFEKERAVELFGDRLIDIMTLIGQPLDFSTFNEREKKEDRVWKTRGSEICKSSRNKDLAVGLPGNTRRGRRCWSILGVGPGLEISFLGE